MPIKEIYFDESGFTGYNLLDRRQPVFVVASAIISDPEADALLVSSFPQYRGQEFKFANLWNSKNRNGLISFVRNLNSCRDRLFVYVVDKRFAVLTKIVDFLIEPYLTASGFDFYDEGFCWKYCNYIYFGLTQFAEPELLDVLLCQYQAFSRDPGPESLATLQFQLTLMASSSEEPAKIFLEQMALGAQVFERYHNLQTFRGSDELQVTSMVASIAYWRQKFSEDFAVVHDASSNFMRNKSIWLRMTNKNVPAQLHRLGDGTYVEYPLRVVSTNAVDSIRSRAVQFCDVFAGLAGRHFNPHTQGEDRVYLDELIDAGLKDVSFNGIRPGEEFPVQIPPKKLVGPDIVDQATKIMFGDHNRGL